MHRMNYPSRHFPLVCFGSSQETTEPYRTATPVVVRLIRTKFALVMGIWGSAVTEDRAMERAINGELIGYVPTRDYQDIEGLHGVTPLEVKTPSGARHGGSTRAEAQLLGSG